MSYIKSDNQFYVPFSTNNVTFNRGCFTENEIETEKKAQNIKEEICNDGYITFKSSCDEQLEEKMKKEKIVLQSLGKLII